MWYDDLEDEILQVASDEALTNFNRYTNRIHELRVGKNDLGERLIMGKVEDPRYAWMLEPGLTFMDKEIMKCTCDCSQYSYYGSKIICEHIVAVALLAIEKLREEDKLKDPLLVGEMLESIIDTKETIDEVVELEVFFETEDDYSDIVGRFYFKIGKVGSKKRYVLKSIRDFINAKRNGGIIYFGKEFEYSSRKQSFNEKDNKIIEIMEAKVLNSILVEEHLNSYRKYNSGKYLQVNSVEMKSIMRSLQGETITVNKKKCIVEDENCKLPIKFKVKSEDDKYTIIPNGELPELLGGSYCGMLLDNKVYINNERQGQILTLIQRVEDNDSKIQFPKKKGTTLFNNIIPLLGEVELDGEFQEIVKEDLRTEFYIDLKNKNIQIEVKHNYGNENISNTDKIIIRDNEKEKNIKETIIALGFYKDKDKFIIEGNDHNIYSLLLEDYKKLENFGEVFYSDRLRNRKVYRTPSISAEIKDKENNFLEFTFAIDNVDPKEYKKILDSILDKRKFYKLKNDSFINLEDESLKDFLLMVDKLDIDRKSKGKIKLNKNKSIVIDDYINRNNLDFIKGKEVVKETVDKLSNIESVDYNIPEDLNADLREYQKVGFKWFKTLEYLGFGGILADEMGLGKTVQGISYMLSEKGKKFLVVAPTSLVYNWKSELRKFAPKLRVNVAHGSKEEREDIVKNYHNYDVLLTSYGTLRNDEEFYENIVFDGFIIDEAQNIKNPLAQVTKVVKGIKAKTKFALTGTPIENNLLELWSIFDFVMPGYLYSSSIFKGKFIGSKEAILELQKYCKPFILRRLKSEVLKELPDKIEKKYYVELSKEERKVYSTYANDIKGKLESNDDENKILLFSYLTKLRQLCLDPKLLIDGYKGECSKIKECISIIKDNIDNGHKILLFSQFTSLLENIKEVLESQNIKYYYIDGGTNAKERINLVNDFNDGNEIKLFLISLKAGGTGLNLTSADMVIHFDPWWNPAVEEQATDRAHRIGQKNVVQVIKLIAEGTIEERIIDLQEEKKELINNVMSGGYNGGNSINTLSKEELVELFG